MIGTPDEVAVFGVPFLGMVHVLVADLDTGATSTSTASATSSRIFHNIGWATGRRPKWYGGCERSFHCAVAQEYSSQLWLLQERGKSEGREELQRNAGRK
jgi:hypothetical protein